MNDETAIWFFQRQKGSKQICWIDYYENAGEGAEHYVGVLKDKPYIVAGRPRRSMPVPGHSAIWHRWG